MNQIHLCNIIISEIHNYVKKNIQTYVIHTGLYTYHVKDRQKRWVFGKVLWGSEPMSVQNTSYLKRTTFTDNIRKYYVGVAEKKLLLQEYIFPAILTDEKSLSSVIIAYFFSLLNLYSNVSNKSNECCSNVSINFCGSF